MDRGAWRAPVHGVTEWDMTEHTRTHTRMQSMFSLVLELMTIENCFPRRPGGGVSGAAEPHAPEEGALCRPGPARFSLPADFSPDPALQRYINSDSKELSLKL